MNQVELIDWRCEDPVGQWLRWIELQCAYGLWRF
jgi:hypothetical protein